ncbi:MAG TPA: DUF3068 domain-containing protein [Streptosporangiaceae bacterium]
MTGLILAGLGAFLIAAAVLMKAYLPGQVLKIPLHEYLVTQLVGHDVSYFSAAKVKPVTGATMVVTATVKSDDSAGNSSTSVWNQFTYLYDTTDHQRFSMSLRRLAFDRRTAELVQCCGASIDGNTHVRQSGLAGFLWPIGTGQHSYQIFDPAMNRAATARYAGTATVGGISVYKFVEKVTGAQAGTQKLPANLVGLPGNKDVTLPETYTATNTFFVDPVTGAQLNEIQQQHLALTDPSTGAERLLLLNATLTNTPKTTRTVVKIDQDALRKVSLLTFILPLSALIAGLVALAAGILLARPRRDEEPGYAGKHTSEPVLDPAL